MERGHQSLQIEREVGWCLVPMRLEECHFLRFLQNEQQRRAKKWTPMIKVKGWIQAVMSRLCVDIEVEVKVADWGSAFGSETDSAPQRKEAAPGQVGYPQLEGLLPVPGVPGQPPGLVA